MARDVNVNVNLQFSVAMKGYQALGNCDFSFMIICHVIISLLTAACSCLAYQLSW